MNILVTGIAGDIGFGVGRILKEWGIFENLIGTDIHEDHPGSLVFNLTMKVPQANDPSYIEQICKIITKFKIKLLIPTSESELYVIANNIDRLNKLTSVLTNSSNLINICLDKHELLNFLDINGLKVPEHGLVGKDHPKKLPVIVKPRRGQGKKGVKKVLRMFEYNISENKVWQELLLPNEQEFTCAVYVSPNLEYKLLQIRRVLIGGYTGKGEIVDNQQVKDYIKKIVNIFKAKGCFNVQLRLTKQGPLLFEINPRLSSTIVFRDKLGFTDLKWWIADKLGLKKINYKAPKVGTKIYRGNTEYIL